MHDTAAQNTAAQIYPNPRAISENCSNVVEDHLAHGIIWADINHIDKAQWAGCHIESRGKYAAQAVNKRAADKSPDSGIPSVRKTSRQTQKDQADMPGKGMDRQRCQRMRSVLDLIFFIIVLNLRFYDSAITFYLSSA